MNRLVLVLKWEVCSINCASSIIHIWLRKLNSGASISSSHCPCANMKQYLLRKSINPSSVAAFGSLFFTSRTPLFQEKKSVRHQTAAKKHLYRQNCAGTFLSRQLGVMWPRTPGTLRLTSLHRVMYGATLSPKSNHLNRWLDNLRLRNCLPEIMPSLPICFPRICVKTASKRKILQTRKKHLPRPKDMSKSSSLQTHANLMSLSSQ